MSTLALWRGRLSYQGISLGVVALLASGALALGNQLTRSAIVAAEARDLAASLAQVLPAGANDNDLLTDTVKVGAGGTTVTVHIARKSGAATGAVFRMAERGYAGDIVVLMGVDTAGRLLGVRVVKHAETPGLGDKIEIAKAPWILAFDGKSLDDPPPGKWAVKKDGGVFDQFAGATITPRAVVKAVKKGLEFFVMHREEILK
jgi:electron transport complex protein RnfG